MCDHEKCLWFRACCLWEWVHVMVLSLGNTWNCQSDDALYSRKTQLWCVLSSEKHKTVAKGKSKLWGARKACAQLQNLGGLFWTLCAGGLTLSHLLNIRKASEVSAVDSLQGPYPHQQDQFSLSWTTSYVLTHNLDACSWEGSARTCLRQEPRPRFSFPEPSQGETHSIGTIF